MSPESQHGFLIPLALILLVGISFLAIAIGRMSGQSAMSSTLEEVSAMAFYAAESGGQIAMGNLYRNAPTRTETDLNCTGSVNGSTVAFNRTGLIGCTSQLACSVSFNPENTRSYYTLYSSGRCGSGALTAERRIQITTFMQ